MLKIGLIHDNVTDHLLDGSDQSGYFLYKILKKIQFDVSLVSFYKSKNFFKEKSNVIKFKDIKNFDLFINISKNLDEEIIKNIFINNKKIITNIHDNILLKLKESLVNDNLDKNFDPSNISVSRNTSLIADHYDGISNFLEIITKSKIKTIPFLWDPDFCLESIGDFDSNSLNKEDLCKVGIFESNNSFYKNSIVPMSICEGVERADSSILKFVFIANIEDKMKNVMFNHYYNNLKLKHNNKLYPYHRSNLSFLISRNAINTVVSNQLFDMYNYTYFETLFLNRPLIHNSKLYKDVGYYYNDFEIINASKLLIKAIKTFNIDTSSNNINKEFLNKFSTDNQDNQDKIKNIILEEAKNEN